MTLQEAKDFVIRKYSKNAINGRFLESGDYLDEMIWQDISDIIYNSAIEDVIQYIQANNIVAARSLSKLKKK